MKIGGPTGPALTSDGDLNQLIWRKLADLRVALKGLSQGMETDSDTLIAVGKLYPETDHQVADRIGKS